MPDADLEPRSKSPVYLLHRKKTKSENPKHKIKNLPVCTDWFLPLFFTSWYSILMQFWVRTENVHGRRPRTAATAAANAVAAAAEEAPFFVSGRGFPTAAIRLASDAGINYAGA